MGRETKIKESVLYEIWQSKNFKRQLKTIEGIDITVLDCGILNNQLAGPDFRNARIRIGNLTYVGDIEIDNSYSDWKIHGHHIDDKYSRVILHVALLNKNNYSHVYSKDGRKIPSMCLSGFIDENTANNIIKGINENPEVPASSLKCNEMNSQVTHEMKESILYQLGIHRFEKKCKRIFTRLKELKLLSELQINEPVVSYDLTPEFQQRKFSHEDFKDPGLWQQLLYESIFEALGYNKNKTQMLELAQNVNLDFISKIDQDGSTIEKYEAIFFNVSGLVSISQTDQEDETKEYLEQLSQHWLPVSNIYDGKIMDSSDWYFFRLRPQNFPTIRIAAGARLLNQILHKDMLKILVKKFTEIHRVNILSNSLRAMFIFKTDGYWKNHYLFGEKCKNDLKLMVGVTRADDIIVNVIIPFFAVYFEIFGKPDISKKIFKLYSTYTQVVENYIIYDVGKSLDMKTETKKSIISQGMLELYRSMCSKNKCMDCEIGKTVFN